MTCAHFTHVGESCCARGVDYQKVAGGGVFTMVYRLPCHDLSNRRGEVAKPCAQHSDHQKAPA